MNQDGSSNQPPALLQTLPGDDVRQIMWRFAERFDYQMVVQSARAVARGPVARAVAKGARNTHEWTEDKAALLTEFDVAGITAASIDPEFGGFLEGPKNFVLGLLAFELAWVDAGSGTSSMANTLALAPIHERGTPEQKQKYMSASVPPQPGEDRKIWRGAFALTESIPYVGVDTGVLSGRVRVTEWRDGEEPLLHVDKRGRFITNMGSANFVTAAVDSGDPRIKGSCMIILEETDPGTWDRGIPTKKLAHQLSSTRDPVFSLQVPASRIIGGYTVKDGVIIPNYSHADVIEAVFTRTRATPAIMTSAKLLSAVEPVIRYHRRRFRGAAGITEGTPRFDMGLQQKEDALHRLLDVWAAGEAGASLGFETSRLLDTYDAIEKAKAQVLAQQGIAGGRAELKALRAREKDAAEYVALAYKRSPTAEESARLAALDADAVVKFIVTESLSSVLIPSAKLWNTGHGVNMMREAVSMMGGYGITEDCPGFLGTKWIDGQLEATYEGPEVVQRRQLSVTMSRPIFLQQFQQWIAHLREVARAHPTLGAGTLASAMELWFWSREHLSSAKDAHGRDLYSNQRHGVTYPLADALAWLVATYHLVLDVIELKQKGPENAALAEGIDGLVSFYSDLTHIHCATAAGEATRICAELVFGYRAEPEAPGSVPGADAFSDVAPFVALRTKVDASLAGSKLAKDRAAESLAHVMIPEVLDYPV
ncbi:MAG TPA: acyl-CoA dehydrogenase family protein [Gemmatimonadaceae bacterium]|jgi:alkylation response protein AidB-like acyl-CoA dehydrogenase